MWVPAQVIEWFTALRNDADAHAEVSREALSSLREELAAVRADRDSLRQQLTASLINSDWFRLRFNELERENKALMEKAYNIKLPVPEILINKQVNPTIEQFSFDDMGDEMAAKLGFPVYGN